VARLACNVLWRSAWREELVGMLSMEDKARGGRSRADTAL
jgi:hypothetical protein